MINLLSIILESSIKRAVKRVSRFRGKKRLRKSERNKGKFEQNFRVYLFENHLFHLILYRYELFPIL